MTDQETVEGEIRTNEKEVKRALKELNDKGGVPNTVGDGLLNAFVNLEDNRGKKKKEEREVDSDDEDE